MEGNNAEIEDIDFSIIGPNKDKPNQLNFSVESLLTISDRQKSLVNDLNDNKQINQNKTKQQDINGSFMRDLGKLQKSISYDSVVYNIYETSQLPADITRTLQGKQESICAKTINNITSVTKGTSRVFQPGFQHLILDFKPSKILDSSLKQRQNFQNYFGLGQINRKKTSQIAKSGSRSQQMKKKKCLSEFPITTVAQIYRKKQVQGLRPAKDRKSLNEFQLKVKTSRTIQSVSPKSIIWGKNSQPLKGKRKQKLEKEHNKCSKMDIRKNSPSGKKLKSLSRSSSVGKNISLKKKTKNNTKDQSKTRNTREDIYSEYFGFTASINSPDRSKMIIGQKPTHRQKSKKKIIFSKKNIYSNGYSSNIADTAH